VFFASRDLLHLALVVETEQCIGILGMLALLLTERLVVLVVLGRMQRRNYPIVRHENYPSLPWPSSIMKSFLQPPQMLLINLPYDTP
jgi:hypothetical protein